MFQQPKFAFDPLRTSASESGSIAKCFWSSYRPIGLAVEPARPSPKATFLPLR